MYTAKSALLREAEQFALCHGANTAVRSYMGDEHKKLLAVTANGYYRNEIQKEVAAVRLKERLTAFSDDQRKRQKSAMEVVDETSLSLALKLEKRKDDVFRPHFRTVEGVAQIVLFGESQRVALIEMLFEGHRQGLVSQGRSPVSLLTGEPLKNSACGVLLLRTFHSLPRNNPSIVVLQESLLTFCHLTEDEEQPNLRTVEVRYAEKLTRTLENLRHRKNAPASLRLLQVFFQISRYFGDGYQYCCGSDLIQNAMVWWQTCFHVKKTAREAHIEIVHPSTQLAEFRKQVQQLADDVHVTPIKAGKNLPEAAEDIEGEGQVVFVQNFEIPAGDATQVTLTQTSGTSYRLEARETPKKRTDVKWDDDLRLHLLDQYLLHAPDPLLSKRGHKGLKSAIKEQVVSFRNEIVYLGSDEVWKDMATDDHRTEIIYRLGFSQRMKEKKGKKCPETGLLWVAEEYLQGTEQYLPPSSRLPEFVKSVRDEIVHFARDRFMPRNPGNPFTGKKK